MRPDRGFWSLLGEIAAFNIPRPVPDGLSLTGGGKPQPQGPDRQNNVSMSMLVGSASPTAMHGPIEHDVSKFFGKLKLSGPPGISRGARMLQSASIVTPQTKSFSCEAFRSAPLLPSTIAISPS